MNIIFLGGVGTVTGSRYLLTADDKNILVDCGLFQGYKELRLRNWAPFPISPSKINSVLLTHAHLDHSGYLPLLVKHGFSGNIYCTEGTKDLCDILLPDSGYLQEEEAFFANKHGFSKHRPALPLYTVEDAKQALTHFRPQSYRTVLSLDDIFQVQFIPAGHIIGAAFVQVTAKNNTILFTGDMGRPQDPVMRAPTLITEADYLVIESTYGNRLHEHEEAKDLIKNIVNDTLSRGGSLIIPSFAVGRAQSILYYLSQLKAEKAIPEVPIYLDSPMAINATDILAHHAEDHRLSADACKALCHAATYIRTVDESKAIDANKQPKIIISASGMATGGRILHHLKTYAPNPKNTILFTGYQAGGTRGDRILKGEKEVKIHGEMIPINAHVEVLGNTSAHADYQEMLDWLKRFTKPPKKVFITHGELEAALSLKAKIAETLGWHCVVPELMQNEALSSSKAS